jgi:hypothetical protein
MSELTWQEPVLGRGRGRISAKYLFMHCVQRAVMLRIPYSNILDVFIICRVTLFFIPD